MENKDVGLLLNDKNIKIHRNAFIEMTKLLGIQVLYRAPRENKTWDLNGELDTFFYEPIKVGCIFEENVDQKTMKKNGWVSELQDTSSFISVPYDLDKLQVGALFIIPSGLDNGVGRVFRVISLQTIPVYPASITCEIAPVYKSKFDRGQFQHTDNDFNLLNEGGDLYGQINTK